MPKTAPTVSKAQQTRDRAKKVILFFLSNFFYAIALQAFYVQNNIAAGGFVGISTVLHAFTPITIGVWSFLFNLPLLAWSLFVFGWKYSLATFASSVVYSVMVDSMWWVPCVTDNLVLAAIGGAVCNALGSYLMFQAETSSGGTDLLTKLLRRKFPSLSFGSMYLTINGICVVFAVAAFRNIELGVVAILAVYITSVVSDKLLSGGEKGNLCYIITAQDPNEMSHDICGSLYRSVTCQTGVGMYRHMDKFILLVVVRPRELPRLKKIVTSHDPQAFVIIAQANEIMGGGSQNRVGHYNADGSPVDIIPKNPNMV